ncbi:cytochrome d ubiquinol oxidase subunit II [Phenylobacterium sp.]|jgi:cytochrome d ubiquinol oxidase subunit II|uniref:cytochrome d ubiquinol oxidase subunit II n=1 Tax=Phenylobacterium sp. TaxID=1871053 RepID=UPI002F3EEFAC
MNGLDLPLIWAGVIAGAVLLYVLLDGFDLGVGVLFPFAGSPAARDVMMDSIAPVWDGNETWLVLGGAGLMAAFPGAYAVVMPALYVPVLTMLMGLILRGVAFEFRLHGRRRSKALWTAAFAGGSLIATLAQGCVLGGFIQGIKVKDGAFAGGPFDWLTPYALTVAAGLVAGYALLGAAWIIWRAEDDLHRRARRWAWIAAIAAALLLAVVSVATLHVDPRAAARWGLAAGRIDVAALAPRLAIPGLGAAGFAVVAAGLARRAHAAPFAGAALVFLSGYLGLAASFFPYVVPYSLTFRQAASAENALALMLAVAGVLLPLILGYTVWVYWLFRGKVGADAGYH